MTTFGALSPAARRSGQLGMDIALVLAGAVLGTIGFGARRLPPPTARLDESLAQAWQELVDRRARSPRHRRPILTDRGPGRPRSPPAARSTGRVPY
jgi:hypothetical protein